MPKEKCACGRPLLHYREKRWQTFVEQMVAIKGPTLVVTVGEWSVNVPRHYIAQHGIKARELPELTLRYGWEVVHAPARN